MRKKEEMARTVRNNRIFTSSREAGRGSQGGRAHSAIRGVTRTSCRSRGGGRVGRTGSSTSPKEEKESPLQHWLRGGFSTKLPAQGVGKERAREEENVDS